MLTIAIPTFNRNEILLKSLTALLPQVSAECRLLILDNCSPVPVSTTLRPLLETWPKLNYQIVRHRCNLGATANILRCFELCETEWLWTLGDDDIVASNAVEIIENSIHENPSACYLSFLEFHGKKKSAQVEPLKAQGVREFIRVMGAAGNINYMSCSVWKTDSFARGHQYAYEYAYSMGWTFALLLSGLEEKGMVILSGKSIIEVSHIAPYATRWSYRKFLLGWSTLLEIPSVASDVDVLAKKLLGFYSPEVVAAYLIADAASQPWPKKYLFYDLVVGRLAPYQIHCLGRIRFGLYRLLFFHPRSGWFIVKRTIGLANRLGLKSINLTDMGNRGT